MALLSEQQTIVSYDLQDRTLSVYSNIPKDIRKFNKLCEDPNSGWKHLSSDQWGGSKYSAPALCLKFKAQPKKREISDEKRAELAARMKEIRATQ